MPPPRKESARTSAARELVSELTTNRLSVYVRCLNYLETQGVTTISSHEFAHHFHLNSAQFRKDLAFFGELGIRGVGYNVSTLRQHLSESLGMNQHRNAVIVGAGNLGMALADFKGFNLDGFRVVALLDIDVSKIEKQSKSGIQVFGIEKLDEIVRESHVEIGIIAVPGEMAQNVYDGLVDAGIRAVLNFAPVQIRRHSGVKLKNVDLRIEMESLSYYLKNVGDGTDPEENPAG